MKLFVKELLLILLLLFVVGGNAVHFTHDHAEGANSIHLLLEFTVVGASLLLIAILAITVWRQAQSNRVLLKELSAVGHQPSPTQAIRVVRREMTKVRKHQFDEWGLTDTEREVGLLLLKGLSFREIAAVRNTVEKTVRQQASSIYHKAGMSGRHAFAAWFVDDLLD